MYNAIVVGTDGSPTASRAVEHAGALAKLVGAPLHLVSAYHQPGVMVASIEGPVIDPTEWTMAALSEVERTLAQTEAALRADGVDVTSHVRQSDPVSAIIDVATETGSDLIVVGNRGMKGARRVLGSVPNSVAHRSPCHVLVVQTS